MSSVDKVDLAFVFDKADVKQMLYVLFHDHVDDATQLTIVDILASMVDDETEFGYYINFCIKKVCNRHNAICEELQFFDCLLSVSTVRQLAIGMRKEMDNCIIYHKLNVPQCYKQLDNIIVNLED